MVSPLIEQYLAHYAEPLARTPLPLTRTYQFVLVIPVHDEPVTCLTQVLPADLQDTLVIVVVNAAEDHDRAVVQRTQALLEAFAADAWMSSVAYTATTTLLLVDCCRDGRQLPAKQGVGLARKIGADLALAYIAQGGIDCPWIHCTDADVVLPADYFTPSPPAPDVAVAIYPFAHHPAHADILHYEIALRYYVTQLAAAGSPYAFETIGSLLKINAHHYAAVRGFPKRKAAEDFYMLNKLAKTGGVVRLRQPAIALASRQSERVPFGTGAAMQKLAQGEDLQFYEPQIFQQLQQWLNHIEGLWLARERIQGQGLPHWWQQQGGNSGTLAVLQSLGLEKALAQAIRQCRDLPHFRFFLWGWFDAFRTLKFVHGLRDGLRPDDRQGDHHANSPRTYASISLADLNRRMGWVNAQPSQGQFLDRQTLHRINQCLQQTEQHLPPVTGPTVALRPPA